ncbi:MAG: putative amidohydrolase [Glaciecola sp.]|jgi:predicted amidohydrolase
MSVLRVAIVQHDIVWEDAAATCASLAPRVAQAAAAGADLVVLTEMFSTGFSMNTAVTAEPSDGVSATWMREQAAAHGVWLAGSVPTLPAGASLPVNRLNLVARDGSVAAHYDKIHTFTHAGESDHFDAGTSSVTVDVEGVRVTLAICYDLRFADQFWAAAPDTDCYLVVANWPAARREHWQSLVRARAIENQAWVIAANRVGKGGHPGDAAALLHVGDSAIVDPLGEVVASASRDEALLVADVDSARATLVRATLPFHADR